MATRVPGGYNPAAVAITGGTITGVTGVPWTLSGSGIPFIKMPSGSMGNNGAVTALTALPKIYSNGAWGWFPAGAVAAGVPTVASWLWFVGSSTTAGTVYNSTYTSGQPQVGVTTAFATTGPGAFAGDTGNATAVSISVPAGSMGVNGRLEAVAGWSGNSTAGNKILIAKLGAATIWSTLITTNGNAFNFGAAQNRGVQTAQSLSFLFGNSSAQAQGATAAVDGAENTANAVTASFILQAAVATDYVVLENHKLSVNG